MKPRLLLTIAMFATFRLYSQEVTKVVSDSLSNDKNNKNIIAPVMATTVYVELYWQHKS
jgi:hypothetical protein